AREDQHAERALDLVRQYRPPHIAVAEIPLALPPHADDRMEADRHPKLLCRPPEWIVHIRAVRPVGWRRAPDHRPFEAHLGATLELAGARRGIVERDHRQPD